MSSTATQNGARTFEVHGRTFAAMSAMPAEAFSDFGDLMLEMSEGMFARAAYDRLTDIVRRALKPDERDAWDAFLAEDLDPPMDFNELLQATDELCASGAGRPSQPLSPSTGSGTSKPTGSTAG